MKRFQTLVLTGLVSMLLATAAFSAERRSVIIVIDPESGEALVPEGTPIPRGIAIRTAEGDRRAFATAPEERFTEARGAILAKASFKELFPAKPFTTGGSRFRISTDDSDETFYIYFMDGSYIWARRYVLYFPGFGHQFGVQSGAYTPAGDYDWGWLYPTQSSATHSGFNAEEYCAISGSGGSCNTPVHAYMGDPATFSAHVTSTSHVHHERSGICGVFGEPPCSDHYDDSFEIDFP